MSRILIEITETRKKKSQKYRVEFCLKSKEILKIGVLKEFLSQKCEQLINDVKTGSTFYLKIQKDLCPVYSLKSHRLEKMSTKSE